MINIEKLSDGNINKLNHFTKNCSKPSGISKNGNSLKLELELKLYDLAEPEEYHDNLDYIHTKIDKIHDNIKITKN